MLQIWEAIILGLVEGITEYLPVSSTGHLILAKELLGLQHPRGNYDAETWNAAIDAFNIVVQGGAILAVLGLYRGRVVQMLQGLVGRNPAGLRLAINIIIAFIPAAVLGVLFDETIEAHLFSSGPVIAALALGGVWMIGIDIWNRRRVRRAEAPTANPGATDPAMLAVADRPGATSSSSASPQFITVDEITPLRALAIGLFQVVAMWPGTSRSMMTIAGGMMLRLRARDAAEFSFLLGLPTLGGACVYKLGKNLWNAHETGTDHLFEILGWGPAIVGLVVATGSAALAVRWLVAFLNRHGLTAFGIYRLLLAAVLWTLILSGMVRISG